MSKASKKMKMTAEQKRIARNTYSRKWKKAHKAQVKAWNQAWAKAQKKTTKKVMATKKAKTVVTNKPAMQQPKVA